MISSQEQLSFKVGLDPSEISYELGVDIASHDLFDDAIDDGSCEPRGPFLDTIEYAIPDLVMSKEITGKGGGFSVNNATLN